MYIYKGYGKYQYFNTEEEVVQVALDQLDFFKNHIESNYGHDFSPLQRTTKLSKDGKTTKVTLYYNYKSDYRGNPNKIFKVSTSYRITH